jgi:hypothetical protein
LALDSILVQAVGRSREDQKKVICWSSGVFILLTDPVNKHGNTRVRNAMEYQRVTSHLMANLDKVSWVEANKGMATHARPRRTSAMRFTDCMEHGLNTLLHGTWTKHSTAWNMD